MTSVAPTASSATQQNKKKTKNKAKNKADAHHAAAAVSSAAAESVRAAGANAVSAEISGGTTAGEMKTSDGATTHKREAQVRIRMDMSQLQGAMSARNVIRNKNRHGLATLTPIPTPTKEAVEMLRDQLIRAFITKIESESLAAMAKDPKSADAQFWDAALFTEPKDLTPDQHRRLGDCESNPLAELAIELDGVTISADGITKDGSIMEIVASVSLVCTRDEQVLVEKMCTEDTSFTMQRRVPA